MRKYNPFSFIYWYYLQAPLEFINIWGNFFKFFGLYLFPIQLLLKTLFSPWKKTGVIPKSVGFDPKELLQRLGANLASRLAGFMARTAIIIFVILTEAVLLVSGLAFLVIWLGWPAAFAASLIYTNLPLLIICLLFLLFSLFCYKTAKEKPADTLTLEEIFKQKWSLAVWERLGLKAEEIPKEVIKNPAANLMPFLKQKQIKRKDFETALIWEISSQKNSYIKKRFWRKENLYSLGGIGRDWIYGYTPLLDQYIEPINALTNYEHLIGRRNELELIERILTKSEQNNALIVGEPGVGKMSLVQKFARLVKAGRVNQSLAYHRVIMLNLKEAMAGVKTAGELEARLIAIFNQASAAGNIILVIDNFHSLINVDQNIAIGKKDISQILIPYLRGGYFQLIAITTYRGLHNQIEEHPGLMKFFEKVEVKEPDKETVKMICQDSVRQIEERVPVKITVQAINEIVERADMYISDTPFPEKALDLLEDAALYVFNKKQGYLVKAEDVDAVISQQTEIPVGELKDTEKEKLANLEELIHQRIVNQDLAVKEIASAMRRSRLEVAEKKRPIGSFLFLGPTGVGKTETAKALAEIYFGSEKRMNRFDMSEFQGAGAVQKMIGSRQKGRSGLLTTAVKENPFSLLLLDEIEKADYSVLNLFVQILEEGWVTDALGRKINFRNQIIIATSNAGAEFIRKKIKENIPEESLNKQLVNYVLEKGIFRPEFLNRFDGVVMFTPLTRDNLIEIARLMLNGLKKRLAKKDLLFKFGTDLVEKVAILGYDPANGARPMRRVIQNKVEDTIAKKLLKGKIQKNMPFTIRADEIN